MDGDGDDLHLRIGRDDLLTEVNAFADSRRNVEQQHVGPSLLEGLPTGLQRVECPADVDAATAVDGVGEPLADHRVMVDDVDVYSVMFHVGWMVLIWLQR